MVDGMARPAAGMTGLHLEFVFHGTAARDPSTTVATAGRAIARGMMAARSRYKRVSAGAHLHLMAHRCSEVRWVMAAAEQTRGARKSRVKDETERALYQAGRCSAGYGNRRAVMARSLSRYYHRRRLVVATAHRIIGSVPPVRLPSLCRLSCCPMVNSCS